MVFCFFSHFKSILVILGHSKSLKVILSHSKSFFVCKSSTRLIGVGLVFTKQLSLTWTHIKGQNHVLRWNCFMANIWITIRFLLIRTKDNMPYSHESPKSGCALARFDCKFVLFCKPRGFAKVVGLKIHHKRNAKICGFSLLVGKDWPAG